VKDTASARPGSGSSTRRSRTGAVEPGRAAGELAGRLPGRLRRRLRHRAGRAALGRRRGHGLPRRQAAADDRREGRIATAPPPTWPNCGWPARTRRSRPCSRPWRWSATGDGPHRAEDALRRGRAAGAAGARGDRRPQRPALRDRLQSLQPRLVRRALPGVLRGLDSYSYAKAPQMARASAAPSPALEHCGRSPGRTSWRWPRHAARARGPRSCARPGMPVVAWTVREPRSGRRSRTAATT
jgi:hypothetical protein